MAVQIQVSDEVWNLLLSMKKKPSDTFDIIIRKLIGKVKFTKEVRK